jgi:hypothetical protein
MTDSPEAPVFCVNHPGRETGLRCNRCGDPICAHCAVRTPVGYRCKKCIRSQQRIFETARWFDFPLAFFTAAVLIGAGSLLSSLIGFWILLAAGLMGTLAARAVQAAVRYRRSRYLWLAAAAGALAGCIPALVPGLLGIVFMALAGDAQYLFQGLYGLLWPGIYLIIAVGALIAGIRGIQL